MSGDQVFAIIMAAIVTSGWVSARIFRGPLGEALARRIGGAGHGSAQHATEQEAQLAEVRARMAELEERVDFTERVLLQERQQGELGGGGRP